MVALWLVVRAAAPGAARQAARRRLATAAGNCVHAELCDRWPGGAVAVRTRVGEAGALRELTFAELQERSRRAAAALRAGGVKRGDRVAVMLPKGPDVFVATVALARLGAVYTPLFTAFEASGAAVRVVASGATTVVTDVANRHKFSGLEQGRTVWTASGAERSGGDRDWDAALARGPALLDADHSAVASGSSEPVALLFSSGTTGNPKGIAVPARALEAFREYMVSGLDVQDSDVYWNVADHGWAYGALGVRRVC
jgi:acetyl-CoA synthetase